MATVFLADSWRESAVEARLLKFLSLYGLPIMTYSDMPVIIPLLATGYLLTIYLLLMLAQRTLKSSRYVTNSGTEAYASYIPTDGTAQTDELERWSLRFSGSTPKELPPELRSPTLVTSPLQKVKEVSSTLT